LINVYLKDPIVNKKQSIKNAFNISYSERSNNLFTAGFSLPAEDKIVRKIKQFSFVEIYDGEQRIELFTVVKSSESYSSGVPVIKYDLLDALFLLNLSVIEFLQLTNPTTKEALQAVMDCQYLPYWKLGDVEFSRGFSYQWENENGLLSPLMSVLDDTAEQYVIERDTNQFPFVLHFRRPSLQVSARIKQGYNMTGFIIEQEGKNLVNWILPKGNAEGINAVDISKLNGGQRYLMDQESMNEFFPAMTIWKDERYTVEENLLEAAKSRLNAWKEPKVNWDVTAVDLTKVFRHPENLKINKNREIKVNNLTLNSLVEVETKKYGKINLRVLERGKSDLTGKPGELGLSITNEGVNAFAYDEERQNEISKMTANGAQNMLPFVFDREADAEHPVEFTFPIYDEVVNVNDCRFWLKTTRYRATSKGNESSPVQVSAATTEGGGAYVSTVTSQGGGASVQSATSSSGGGSVQSATSSSGGGQTSSSGGDHRHRMFIMQSNAQAISAGIVYVAASSSLGGNRGVVLTSKDGDPPGDLYTAGSSGNHSHTVSNHTHNVSINIPSHTHDISVTIPSHTHNIVLNIPNHTHRVTITIPSHTHPIVYGIFEYNGMPSAVEVSIDGNKIPTTALSYDGIDLKPYLKKDSSGKVTRGDHTLKIKPNDLARFEISIILTIFIKSRLGGKY
jgi:phage minor structural protein